MMMTAPGDCGSITDCQQGGSDCHDEWIETARIIDRFCFVVLFIIVVVIVTGLLILLAVNGPRRVEPSSAKAHYSSFDHVTI